MFQPSSIAKLRNAAEMPALLALVAYLAIQISIIMGRTTLIYLPKQIPAFSHHNQHGYIHECQRFILRCHGPRYFKSGQLIACNIKPLTTRGQRTF